MLVRAGADLTGEGFEQGAEHRRVDGIGDEPDDLAAGWPDEAIQVEPLVAMMPWCRRALATRRPDPADDRLQPDAVFVQAPDLERKRRLGAGEFDDFGLELFLNRCCSIQSAPT